MALKRKCIGCGAPFDFIAGTVYVCPYCGTEQNPGINADLMDILFNANNLRRNKQFDRARAEYKRVLDESPEIGEAHIGLFYCDYEINEEKDLLNGSASVNFTNASRHAVAENPHYKEAIAYAGKSRSEWESYAAKIEELRSKNLNLKKNIKSNGYRVALICDPSCACDRTMADEIFDSLRSRVDVFYPPYTLQATPESMRENATLVALDNVALLFLVCSQGSQESPYLMQCYDKFFETHESYLITVIGDEDDIPAEIEYDECVDPDCDDVKDSLLTQIRLMGNLSHEEAMKFRNGEACVKNSSNPSPILN